MEQDTANEMLRVLTNSCDLLGKNTGIKSSPDEIIRRGAKLLLIESSTPLARKAAKVSERGALAWFRALPEPKDESEKRQLLSLINDLPFTLRRAFAGAAKKLPNQQGKHSKFKSEDEKREACEAVKRALGLGSEKTATFDLVAGKYDVSQRTMRRAWKLYAEQQSNDGRAKRS